MRTSGFKSYQRGQRALTTEETFLKGMYYTDTPLGEGACKALVNYDFKDNGMVLVPRGGLRTAPANISGLSNKLFKTNIHHIGQTVVTVSQFITELHRYALFTSPLLNVPECKYTDMQVLIEDRVIQGAPVLVPAILNQEAEGEYALILKEQDAYYQIHNMPFTTAPSLPIHCILNNTPYFPIRYTNNDTVTTRGLGKLSFRKGTVEQDNTDAIIGTVSKVVPKEITPNEAVNYGYNMLHPTPYSFIDQLSPAVGNDYILLHGILPYADDVCTIPKFNARVGEPITFRLFCSFPNGTSTYKFKWEIRDLASDTVQLYEGQDSAYAPLYHYDDTDHCAKDADGNKYVTFTFNPPFKEFSIAATAYAANDLTEPLQVMLLASYHLTADAPGSTASIEVKNYDLSTAKGMCVWQQRVVLWGVQSGEQILFTSDPNDPTYFPYPNNVDLFDEIIIGAVPYLSDLLVFTESRLYKLSFAADGLSFSKTVIQEKLMLSDFDASTICVIKNMVYFKNGNYFYMIVPTTNETKGELQLAPISKQITNLLDNFEREVMDMIMTVYNPERFERPLAQERFKLNLLLYHNYMDNNAMRNVYKFSLDILNEHGAVRTTTAIFDFVLNYDTMLRVWSAYVVEANTTKLLPYKQTVTDTTLFINLAHNELVNNDEESVNYGLTEYLPQVELIKPYPLNPKDNFLLDIGLLPDGRRLKNWQYIDTGFRNHDQQLKKRYREMQFKINNISQQSLEFGTEFVIDDDLRKALFEYSVGQLDVDPDSPYFGWIYIDREYANPVIATGAAILAGEDDIESQPYPNNPMLTSGDVLYSNRWVLNYSPLARVASTKVRFPVSGKGYCPRLKLLSFNEQLYELLLFGYVYRVMFAR